MNNKFEVTYRNNFIDNYWIFPVTVLSIIYHVNDKYFLSSTYSMPSIKLKRLIFIHSLRITSVSYYSIEVTCNSSIRIISPDKVTLFETLTSYFF